MSPPSAAPQVMWLGGVQHHALNSNKVFSMFLCGIIRSSAWGIRGGLGSTLELLAPV